MAGIIDTHLPLVVVVEGDTYTEHVGDRQTIGDAIAGGVGYGLLGVGRDDHALGVSVELVSGAIGGTYGEGILLAQRQYALHAQVELVAAYVGREITCQGVGIRVAVAVYERAVVVAPQIRDVGTDG